MHSDGVDAMSKLQLRLLICCHRMWGVILHSSVLATDVVIGSLMQALSVKDFFSVFLCLCPPQHSYQVADAMCDIRDSCFFWRIFDKFANHSLAKFGKTEAEVARYRAAMKSLAPWTGSTNRRNDSARKSKPIKHSY